MPEPLIHRSRRRDCPLCEGEGMRRFNPSPDPRNEDYAPCGECHGTGLIVKPVLLDLYCCQGGAGEGYRQAGFHVIGVDLTPQPRNPYTVIAADAIGYLAEHGADYDAIHASPPCRRYSDTQRIRGNDHPDLIGPTRDVLLELGKPYVIENVPGARDQLRDPIMLCGAMFPELRVYRHRLFEANWPLEQPPHPPHVVSQVKMGRQPLQGEFIQCVGNFSNVDYGRDAMGMPWATREGLREAIPPAYTRWVGERLLEHINGDRKGLAHAA